MVNKFFIFLIQLYKKFISPLLPASCRFYPSCSEYAILSFQRFNFFKALYLSTSRILRCNPMSEGYHDPVPECKHKK